MHFHLYSLLPHPHMLHFQHPLHTPDLQHILHHPRIQHLQYILSHPHIQNLWHTPFHLRMLPLHTLLYIRHLHNTPHLLRPGHIPPIHIPLLHMYHNILLFLYQLCGLVFSCSYQIIQMSSFSSCLMCPRDTLQFLFAYIICFNSFSIANCINEYNKKHKLTVRNKKP